MALLGGVVHVAGSKITPPPLPEGHKPQFENHWSVSAPPSLVAK